MNYKEKVIALLNSQELSKEQKEQLENIFPELKECEGERIRKEFCKDIWTFIPNEKANKYIAWLEKQGKQTHAELGQSEVTKTSDQELEPKFHEGDWIISNDKKSTYQVIEVKRGVYVIRDNVDNHEYHIDIEGCEKSGRFWTIQDAKNGDVLCYETKDDFRIFIYKGGHIHYHCCYSNEHLTPVESFFVLQKHQLCYIHPATKEQRELLFQKMKEAGYEWDQKEKKPIKMKETKFKPGDWIANGGANPCYVKSIFGDYYELCSCEGFEYTKHIKDVDYIYHLWTIQDAKDGDVLVCPSDLGDRLVVFIFKQLVNHASEIDCHCCIDANGIFDPCLNDCCYLGDASRDDYAPATKEQRDLLFAKMRESGYEWDVNKKELKEIEHKTLNADKVIAWLVANIIDFEYYVKLFKKDFKL